MKHLKSLFAALAIAVGLSAPAAAADHLLISEVLMNSPGTESDILSAEFIEIYNPTSDTVDLSDYILTDFVDYHLLSASGGYSFVDTADYMLQFPEGAQLVPGQIAVVTQDAAHFFANVGSTFGGTSAGYFAQAGSPLLFEINDSDAAVPQIVNLKPPGTPKEFTFAKTNGGEYAALVYWDGETDLVSDVDAVRWGVVSSGNQPKQKGAEPAVDGPDEDAIAQSYQTDAQAAVWNFTPDPLTAAMARISRIETGEVASGGNGITGNDETTEDLMMTFEGAADTAVTPGVPHPSLANASVVGWTLY